MAALDVKEKEGFSARRQLSAQEIALEIAAAVSGRRGK
jgi:hypothetical protein